MSADTLVLTRGEQRRVARAGVFEYWPVDRLEWTSSDPAIASVSQHGVLMAVREGQCDVIVRYGSGSVTRRVEVVPMVTADVTVLDRRPLPLPRGADCQGVLVTHAGRFISANRAQASPIVARLDASFSLVASEELSAPGWTALHAGSLAERGAEVLVALMDPVTSASKGPSTPVRLGLGRRDAATLAEVGFYDLTGIVSYLDAIDADEQDLWLSSAGTFVRIPFGVDGPDGHLAVWYRKTVPGELQGLRIHGDRLFAALESTSSEPRMAGLLEFELPALVPAVFGDAWEPTNAPLRHHRFAFPSVEAPDLESFDFDEMDPRVVYITDIPANTVISLRLSP